MTASVGELNMAKRRAAAMVSVTGKFDTNLFSKTSRPAVELILPPAQWVQGTLTSGEKLTIHICFVPRFKNWWGYTYNPPYTFSECTETSLSKQRQMLIHNNFHSNSRLANQKERCSSHMPLKCVGQWMKNCIHS